MIRLVSRAAVITALCGMLLGGCASGPAAAPQETAPTAKAETLPGWVTDPDFQGRYGAVGYAKPGQAPYVQRQTALIVAKARLSERMGVQIESLSVSHLSDVDGNVSSSYHNRIVQTASNRINRVTVRDEYRDKAGVLYLWLTAEKGE